MLLTGNRAVGLNVCKQLCLTVSTALPDATAEEGLPTEQPTPLQSAPCHSYQHQLSVSSCASVQTTVLMEGGSVSSNNSSGNGATTTCFPSQLVPSLGGNRLPSSISMSESCSSPAPENSLTVEDVAELLHPQYAILSGARSMDGCSLITFPDRNNFQHLSDCDYQKLIYYLTSVPS